MSIFHHIDGDGDELEVLAGTHLEFHMAGEVGAGVAVHVDRDAALRLHAALGEWLYPVHTPEWANKSLIEQMIEKAVKDQVAAVLPLHLKPGDSVLVVDADGRLWADPEPHDVGHAEEPEDVHRPQYCPGQPECAEGEPKPDTLFAPGARAYYREALGLEPEPTDHGRLMSELPRRTRPRPVCVSCGHGWGEHTGGICWGEHAGNHCTCTRERLGTAGTA